ncbi:MAG: transglycosylase SLT domain-containing protein [Flavobacteriales bacterium]
MKHFFAFCLTLVSIGSTASNLPDSLASETETKDTNLVLRDDPYAAQLDSAIHCYYEDLVGLAQDIYSPNELYLPDSAPVFSAEVYRQRLMELDKRTPFDLTYNTTIEAFIHLYVSKKRQLSSNCLGRADLYFPMIEETLDKHNLPIELKYLAVVESGLNPTARSRAGATGLWQFMYGTGKNFGLTVDSYVDERCDPAQATEAACKYLSYLYNMFGDWNLALAAYNCGEGRVTKAIRRSGGKRNYWEIYPYLPRETRGYVPAFVAVNYMFAHASDHNLSATPAHFPAFAVDSVHVTQPVTFSQVASLLAMSEDDVKYLNPVYRSSFIPAYGEYNVLWLPKDKLNLWVSNHEVIAAELQTEATTEEVQTIPEPQELVYYTVRSGDCLGTIAERHGCSVRQLQEWNNIHGTSLRVGQKLSMYANHVKTPQLEAKPTKSLTVEQSGDNVYYSIRSGDTLWDISKARGVSLEDLKRWNSHVNFNNLKPGQKIIIGKSS